MLIRHTDDALSESNIPADQALCFTHAETGIDERGEQRPPGLGAVVPQSPQFAST